MGQRGERFWDSGLGQALLSGGIVGGVLLTVLAGILLTYQEQLAWATPSPEPRASQVGEGSLALPTPTRPEPTATSVSLPTAAPAVPTPATPPPTLPSPPFTCPPPAGWQPYIVQEGDTLPTLAWQWGTTTYALIQANCLPDSGLAAGQILYRPPSFPQPTLTVQPLPVRCTKPPSHWKVYVVQGGDTLSNLAIRFGTTVSSIMSANCLASELIYAGQRLYLPPRAIWRPPATTPTRPSVPWPTPTGLPFATPTPWPTATAWPTLPPYVTATPTWAGPMPTWPPTPRTTPIPPPTVPLPPTPTSPPPPPPTPPPPTAAPTSPPAEPPTPVPPPPPPTAGAPGD